jgi:hypothetical protein
VSTAGNERRKPLTDLVRPRIAMPLRHHAWGVYGHTGRRWRTATDGVNRRQIRPTTTHMGHACISLDPDDHLTRSN